MFEQEVILAVQKNHEAVQHLISQSMEKPEIRALIEDLAQVMTKYRDNQDLGIDRDDYVIASIFSAVSTEMSNDVSPSRIHYLAQLVACIGGRVAEGRIDLATEGATSKPAEA